MKNNPLHPHGAHVVNVVEEVSKDHLIRDVKDIKTLLLAFHARLMEVGLINDQHDNCKECVVHPLGCQFMHNDIQSLISQGVLQVTSLEKKEEVAVIEPFNLLAPVNMSYLYAISLSL